MEAFLDLGHLHNNNTHNIYFMEYNMLLGPKTMKPQYVIIQNSMNRESNPFQKRSHIN